MAQAGYTPISLYYSTTASAVPTAGNLVAGELALNTADGKLYFKNSSNVVTLLAQSGTLPISSGGTGQTTASAAFNALSPITTTGDLIIGNGTNSATRLGIGANGFVLTSNGTTATWAASTGGVTSFSAGTTGFTPSTGTTGAITLAGTLGVANGGTGLTTLTANNVILGNGASNPTFVAPGTNGNVLTSNGTTWVSSAPAASGVSQAQAIAYSMTLGF